MKPFITPLIGFLLLTLYFNVPLTVFQGNTIIELFILLSIFPLTHVVAKKTNLKGLADLGIAFQNGWKRNFFISFAIGFSFWMIKYTTLAFLGYFDWIGVKPFGETTVKLLVIIVGYFLGSITNDMLIRGYVFAHLKGKLSIGWVGAISIILYCLDDVWRGGFTFTNMLFSLVLGLSFTYAFYKTGSIWANTGLHVGLNVSYGLLNGMGGGYNEGIFFITELKPTDFLEEVLSIGIPVLMFLLVYQLLTKTNWYVKRKVK